MRILSLGAGVQSSALALMAHKKYIDNVDFAIFADTGNEPDTVYEYLEYLKSIVHYDIFIISKGNLYNDTINNIQNNNNQTILPDVGSINEDASVIKDRTSNY